LPCDFSGSTEIIEKFKIGYAPSSGLKGYLNSSDIEDKILIDVGLINKSFRDYFCNRPIFHVRDVAGKVNGFWWIIFPLSIYTLLPCN
jgi:DNA primase